MSCHRAEARDCLQSELRRLVGLTVTGRCWSSILVEIVKAANRLIDIFAEVGRI